jgi:hypothetical protein
MKTRKHNLNAIAMGVALAMGSMTTALAAPPVPNPAVPGANAIIGAELASTAPSFNTNEQVGLGLIESVVSLLASRTNDFGCDTRTYDLSVFTDSRTTGFADIGGGVNVGGTTLEAVLGPRKDIGWRLKVDDASGLNLLNGIEVVDYNGAHGWSRTNEIFNSNATIILKDPQTGSSNSYKEVDIKDYFKRVVSGRSWEFDWGLEDIKKLRVATTTYPFDFYYPVQKWQEASWYQHENGLEGQLFIYKYLVIPRSASGCQIRVEAPEGSLFNGSGEFELDGTVTVGRFEGLFPN